jgi:DNA-binding transcriptional LysR family regulator
MELMVDNSETYSNTLGGALEDVRAVCAVLELGTISAAARQLGETKGGLSRRVSRLERRLGAVLFGRTPRAVTATEEGLAFYAKARDALQLLDDAAEDARQSREVPRGHLRVTAPHDLGLDVLPSLVAGFRAVYPQITVELVLSDLALDLAANRIDLALRAATGTLPDTGYRASALIDIRIGLYASPGYLAERSTPQAPGDLESHDLVAMAGRSQAAARLKLVGSRGRGAEVLASPVMRVSDYAGVHRLLLSGAGIGAVPDIVAAPSVAAGWLVAVLPDWVVAHARLYAISVAGREAPARVRVFRAFMGEQLARMMDAAGSRSEQSPL